MADYPYVNRPEYSDELTLGKLIKLILFGGLPAWIVGIAIVLWLF